MYTVCNFMKNHKKYGLLHAKKLINKIHLQKNITCVIYVLILFQFHLNHKNNVIYFLS